MQSLVHYTCREFCNFFLLTTRSGESHQAIVMIVARVESFMQALHGSFQMVGTITKFDSDIVQTV